MKPTGYHPHLKVTSILVLRLALFVILLGSSLLFLPLSSLLLSFFAIYGLVTLVFLLSLVFSSHPGIQRWFALISYTQLFLEIWLEALAVTYSGGINSPLAILFFLTIVSASMNHQLVGTILVASWASLTYTGTILLAAGWDLSSLFSLRVLGGVYNLGDEYFYTLFIYLCSFYLVAFSSGYLAQRLKIKAELLLTASRQLRRVRMETDDILEHLHSGLITIDQDGRVIYFNQAAEEILQYRKREVKGKDCRAVFSRRMPQLTVDLLAGLESSQTENRKEIEISDSQGNQVPIGMSTSLLQDEEGKVVGVIALFQDLTHIKQLQEQLRTKDKLAAIGELAAGIAHEIRNPLASISGSVEVLRQELPAEGDNQNLLDLILKESQRLNKILTDFLNFARIRSSYFSRVDLVPLLEEVVEIVQKHPSYRPEIKIVTDLPLHPVLVQGEENHLKQLFLNLTINAVEAMEGKAGKIVISGSPSVDCEGLISSSPAKEEWVPVAITDQGRGMTSGQKEKIFLPFYSTKKQGTGLGLAIVQRLIDSLNGKIGCKSAPGQGTTFVVHLRKYQPEIWPQVQVPPQLVESSRNSL